MKFLITILLLFGLVSTQAGVMTLEQCLCSGSEKHRVACCCGPESQADGLCCKKSDNPEESLPTGSSVAIEKTKKPGSSCLCINASDDQSEPAPAEIPSENLLESLSVSDSVVLILPLPQPPTIHAAPRFEKLKPPASPRRIQFCSFQL